MGNELERAIEYSERHYAVLGSWKNWLICGTFAANIGPTQIPELDPAKVDSFKKVTGEAVRAGLRPLEVEEKRHFKWDKRACAARMTSIGVEIPEPIYGLSTLFTRLEWRHSENLIFGVQDDFVVLVLVGRRPLCQDPPDSSLSKREISRLNKKYPPICQGCGTLIDKTALAVAVAYSDILRCNECRRVLHAPESSDSPALRSVAP